MWKYMRFGYIHWFWTILTVAGLLAGGWWMWSSVAFLFAVGVGGRFELLRHLAESLDPKWPGPAPYTLLIDKDGKVLYRKVGVIDPAEVTTVILDTLTHYHTVPARPPVKKKPKPSK